MWLRGQRRQGPVPPWASLGTGGGRLQAGSGKAGQTQGPALGSSTQSLRPDRSAALSPGARPGGLDVAENKDWEGLGPHRPRLATGEGR